jgi:hypothetical protein
MIEIDGKKVSQQEVDLMLIVACKRLDLNAVIKCTEEYGANLNAMDAANYARVLVYALRACEGKDSKGETIVKYLVNHGAEVNFKHGDKGSYNESRPYFIYWAADNTNFVSDDLVEFLIKKGGASTLSYVPTTKRQNFKSAKEIIKTRRPEIYKKLLKNKVVTDSVKR